VDCSYQERFADFDFKEVRKHWELKLNQYSEREQSLRRYDSRSFEDQGLEKIAEIPLTSNGLVLNTLFFTTFLLIFF
jgi:predicted transposase YbfD/YdcC